MSLRSAHLRACKRQQLYAIAEGSIPTNQITLTEPDLIAALDDPDPVLSRAAFRALVDTSSTSPVLVRMLVDRLEAETEKTWLQHSRDPFRIDPAASLVQIKPAASTLAPLLHQAMASPDPYIRRGATAVLCDAAKQPGPTDPILAELLLAALRDREILIRMPIPVALARLDEGTRRRAVAILVEQLRDGERLGQFAATLGLAWFGPEARPAVALLADRLRRDDPPRPPASGPPGELLVSWITHQPMTPEEAGPGVDARASRATDLLLLGRLGPVARPAVPEIVRTMTRRDAEEGLYRFVEGFYVKQGGWHWTELEAELSFPFAGHHFAGTLPTLRGLGADVLALIGPGAEREAVGLLIAGLRDEDESGRPVVAEALGAMGPKASAAFPDLLALAERERPATDWVAESRLIKATANVCQGDDPRLVAALVRLLRSKEARKRDGAARVLIYLEPPPPGAVPALIEALGDRCQSVRFASAQALGRYGRPRFEAVAPALLDALKDEDDGVRFEAAQSLAHHRTGAERIVPLALRWLRHKDLGRRMDTAKLLGALGPAAGPAAPALREALRDPDGSVREEAAKALRAIAPPGEPAPEE